MHKTMLYSLTLLTLADWSTQSHWHFSLPLPACVPRRHERAPQWQSVQTWLSSPAWSACLEQDWQGQTARDRSRKKQNLESCHKVVTCTINHDDIWLTQSHARHMQITCMQVTCCIHVPVPAWSGRGQAVCPVQVHLRPPESRHSGSLLSQPVLATSTPTLYEEPEQQK